MPIKPENKKRYPANWKEISEYIRFERAENKCEECGVPNYAVGFRDVDGAFIPTGGNEWHDKAGKGELSYKEARRVAAQSNVWGGAGGSKYIVIVLTVAHLDHTPENCDHDNLKAMCQRCHNQYDMKTRQENRRFKNQIKLKL